jgi:hypothetical protein
MHKRLSTPLNPLQQKIVETLMRQGECPIHLVPISQSGIYYETAASVTGYVTLDPRGLQSQNSQIQCPLTRQEITSIYFFSTDSKGQLNTTPISLGKLPDYCKQFSVLEKSPETPNGKSLILKDLHPQDVFGILTLLKETGDLQTLESIEITHIKASSDTNKIWEDTLSLLRDHTPKLHILSLEDTPTQDLKGWGSKTNLRFLNLERTPLGETLGYSHELMGISSKAHILGLSSSLEIETERMFQIFTETGILMLSQRVHTKLLENTPPYTLNELKKIQAKSKFPAHVWIPYSDCLETLKTAATQLHNKLNNPPLQLSSL